MSTRIGLLDPREGHIIVPGKLDPAASRGVEVRRMPLRRCHRFAKCDVAGKFVDGSKTPKAFFINA
jgi:hypothetical protein